MIASDYPLHRPELHDLLASGNDRLRQSMDQPRRNRRMIYRLKGRRYRVRETDAGLIVEQEQQRQGEQRWVRLHPRMNYCKRPPEMRPPSPETRLLLERVGEQFAHDGQLLSAAD